MSPDWVKDDGGRAAAGFKGQARDCAARAVAIATGRPYQWVYDRINELAQLERPRGNRKRSDARTGVYRVTLDRLMKELGWKWTPTMRVGGGCTTHLRNNELPSGRIIVRVSRHFVAMIDGVVHDTHNPSREGTRCVYGYWRKG